MEYVVELLVPVEHANEEAYVLRQIKRKLHQRGVDCQRSRIRCTLERSSLDARRRVAKRYMRWRVSVAGVGEKAAQAAAGGEHEHLLPVWKKASGSPVVVVGAGPAGLFAALRLLEAGVRPLVVERGSGVEARVAALEAIKAGCVSDRCNVCFGEGGAGTFSDGKLFTTTGKRLDTDRFLATLAHFGASKHILTRAHPHVGSDKLPAVVRAIRSLIEECGGGFLFDTQVVGLLCEGSGGGKVVRGVRVASASGDKEIRSDAVILAAGGSAADVWRMVARESPACLEAKGFAMGVRVEHPRQLIDSIQYGGKVNRRALSEAARYKFTCQVDGRGVYSFCMCPGGFVIPAATAQGEVVVNGMSLSTRSSPWSNAALVVQITACDIPECYSAQAKDEGCAPLAGLLWRQGLEHQAFGQAQGSSLAAGDTAACVHKGCTAPAQRLVDFLAGRASATLPAASYAPGVVPSRLDEWLPHGIARRLREGLLAADKAMRGFVCEEALLVAPETRTSCPVRIRRDKASGECVGLGRLFPAGEGAGWAGGITSSALDGQRAADGVLRLLSH